MPARVVVRIVRIRRLPCTRHSRAVIAGAVRWKLKAGGIVLIDSAIASLKKLKGQSLDARATPSLASNKTPVLTNPKNRRRRLNRHQRQRQYRRHHEPEGLCQA